jgi:flagellar basal-body rod protein FlgG
VFRVRDMQALRPAGAGKFEDLANQQLELAGDGVQQGYQEGSNVDSLQELVQMIVVQRSFSATQKALTSVGRMQDQLVANINR